MWMWSVSSLMASCRCTASSPCRFCCRGSCPAAAAAAAKAAFLLVVQEEEADRQESQQRTGRAAPHLEDEEGGRPRMRVLAAHRGTSKWKGSPCPTWTQYSPLAGGRGWTTTAAAGTTAAVWRRENLETNRKFLDSSSNNKSQYRF